MLLKSISLALMTSALLTACDNNPAAPEKVPDDSATVAKDSARIKDSIAAATPAAPDITYSFVKKKEWINKKDSFEGAKHLDILIAINRADSSTIKRLDSILVPSRYDLPKDDYLPFPKTVAALKDVKKILIFSNPAQAFAAYEYGKLIRQGQTNSGKKATPTPPKLYYCNWKAKRTISTSNSDWILNWNFNVSNLGGIGFHQYSLPGYPASHSCLRLQNADAFFLYNWAEQWILEKDKEVAKGTPVLVYSQYPFGQPRPWYALVKDPQALTLTQDSIKNMLGDQVATILQHQATRDQYLAAKNSTTP